ncbi:MAG: hypothetical protein IJ814_04330 [Paludibacteraceae bacterium]|nr:hypothetical protein [Paludibacteraceae bacterium]
MALRFTLESPFRTMSGVISRKRLADGRVETVIATKRGTIYKRTSFHKGSSLKGSLPRRG